MNISSILKSIFSSLGDAIHEEALKSSNIEPKNPDFVVLDDETIIYTDDAGTHYLDQ